MRFSTEVSIVTFVGTGKWEHGFGKLVPIQKESLMLFADNVMSDEVLRKINEALDKGYQIIVISPDTETPIADNRITYVSMRSAQYNDFNFESIDGTQAITFGQVSYWLAKSLNLEVIQVEDLPSVGKEAIFIQTFDGLGDQLMLIPSIKTHVSLGRTVDIHARNKEAFENIPYVRRIYEFEEDINSKRYLAMYNTSFKLSAYEEEYCRQHRIKATAECCGLKGSELVINKPEIFLTDGEKLIGAQMIQRDNGRKKIVLCLGSNDPRRSYPASLRQKLIDILTKNIPNSNIIMVGDCDYVYNKCINLVRKTNIRELFAVISNSDLVITIDSAPLHIAAAFDTPNILLPSTICGEWRAYESTTIINPRVNCYPCNDREKHSMYCGKFNRPSRSCLDTISQKKIVITARRRLGI